MGKFVISKVKTGFKFNLKAQNGEIIATSEVYTGLPACKNGIASVKACANAPVEDQTVKDAEVLKHPKYELYTDKAGEYRFRLKAKNGEIIAVGEGYKGKAGALGGIASIGKNAPDAEITEE